MGGRTVAGRGRRHVDGGAAELDGLAQRLDGPVGVDQRGRTRPAAGGGRTAQKSTTARLWARLPGVEQVDVATHEHGGGEGGEHELALEAEQVEHVAALGRDRTRPWRASPCPAAAAPRPRRGLAGSDRRRSALAVASSSTADSRSIERPFSRSTHVVLDEGVEKAGQLHQVAVGIEDRTTVGVGHGAVPSPARGRLQPAWTGSWTCMVAMCNQRRSYPTTCGCKMQPDRTVPSSWEDDSCPQR